MVSQVSHLNLATTVASSAGSVVAEPLGYEGETSVAPAASDKCVPDEGADSGAEILHPIGYPHLRTHSDTSAMPCRMTPA